MSTFQSEENEFVCILDCQDLEFVKVQEVIYDNNDVNNTNNCNGIINDTNINNTEVDDTENDTYTEGERYNSDVNKDFNDVAKSLDSIISGFEARKSRDTMTEWFKKRRNDVNFVVDDWAIRIWKENVFYAKTFPKVIFIEYRTKPCGQSVLWRKNQVDCLMKTCMLSAGVRVHAWGLKP